LWGHNYFKVKVLFVYNLKIIYFEKELGLENNVVKIKSKF